MDKVVKWPGFWFTEDEDYAREHGKFIKKVYLNLKNPFNCELPENDRLLGNYMKKYGNGQEDCVWTKAFRDYLIGLGYDGMMWLHSGFYTYVAFYPNQIKSIDNMRPTDSNNLNK